MGYPHFKIERVDWPNPHFSTPFSVSGGKLHEQQKRGISLNALRKYRDYFKNQPQQMSSPYNKRVCLSSPKAI